MNLTSWNQGGLGIFTIPNYIRPDGDLTDVINVLIGIAIAMVVFFALTFFFFWKDEAGETDDIQKRSGKEIVKTPIQGQIAPLNAAKDAAFAQGTLGRGILIYPEKGEVRLFDGTVMTLFPTKHAIGMVSETGLELLIHVGLDTVQLEGKYFESLVQQGERVKQGDLLLRFDKRKSKGRIQFRNTCDRHQLYGLFGYFGKPRGDGRARRCTYHRTDLNG